jgi:hypothetical protein
LKHGSKNLIINFKVIIFKVEILPFT